MQYNDFLAKLLVLTKINNISQADIAAALNLDRAAIHGRAKRNSQLKDNDIEQIEKYYNIKFKDVVISPNSWHVKTQGQFGAPEAIGQRLSLIQDELGYMDKAMARIMKIDEMRYMRIKVGEVSPTAAELLNLANKIEVSLDWLIKGEN